METVDFSHYIGARIKKKRKELRISIAQLAELLKLSTQQVQKYESGASKITADKLALVSFILSEPIDYFYKDVDFNAITIGRGQQQEIIRRIRQQKLRVLLVEENPDDAIRFAKVAENKTLVGEVEIERSASNVFPRLLNHQKTPNHYLPDIIFLDCGIAGGEGFEILKRLKQDHKLQHLVVVVLSASMKWEDMQRCYRLGAASYILKSSDNEQYSESLKQVLSYWSKEVILPNM